MGYIRVNMVDPFNKQVMFVFNIVDPFNKQVMLIFNISQRGLGWVGKVRSLRAPHLGSILAARRSPLAGILSEGWPPHTVLGWVSSSWSRYWLPARGCNITIKAPILVSQKKKKKGYKGIKFCYYCLISCCNYMFITIFMVLIVF